jgi:ATP-dependent helicase/nuclease subunit A
MSQGSLTVYNASAGSGKTYTLTGIYLSAIFSGRYNYRKILAVTFTNKATAEMKSRILDNLHRLSEGQQCEYLGGLMDQTGRGEELIRHEAGEILNAILHDYSRFSVSTIDSFFQKVIRAFAREAGLHAGYSIELDHDLFLSAAIDELISSAPGDTQLRNWLKTYALSNIDEGKAWNFREGVTKLAGELFREKFKVLSKDEMDKLSDKEFLSGYISRMKEISFSFENYLTGKGKEALDIFRNYGLRDDMFYQKGKGIPQFVRKLAEGEMKEPNCYVREVLTDLPRWSSGPPPAALKAAIDGGLGNIIRDSVSYWDRNIRACRTAQAITSNIYALGIITDILRNIRKLTASENTFLLSEAGEFLNQITECDQVPFIYEKVGNRYENFMIDEFQDTSLIQWKNFKPLIENSMAQGFDNLVVGDIKQSIYRWRNSDWRILGTLLNDRENDRIKSIPLETNWRSCRNIIRFNNSMFTVIPRILDDRFEAEPVPEKFSGIYSQAIQQDSGKKEGGYVRIEFIGGEDELTWQDQVLQKIPGIIQLLQDKGYSASGTGILVRDNREGAMILRHLIDYANNHPGEAGRYNYKVVSNDSLLLINSPVVNFIISVLMVLNDPEDLIASACMFRSYLFATGSENASSVMPRKSSFSQHLPAGYQDLFEMLKQMPLFSAVERIIMFFGLGNHSSNVAYINAFQDLVLSFSGSGNPGIPAFLEWWESSGRKKSLVLPANQDAIRILTIHKSKGLEFDAVILPFISWDMDHKFSKQPLLWVKPDVPPFNELGVVPVKYSGKLLEDTIFESHYRDEKYSVYIDNLNLLYVAMTRARNVLFGFSPLKSSASQVNGILNEALQYNQVAADLMPSQYFNTETNVFEFGDIPEVNGHKEAVPGIAAQVYPVNISSSTLRLKLHGENYFSSGGEEIRKKINHGKIMHEVFEGIDTAADIDKAVRKIVLEGKLPEHDAGETKDKVRRLVSEAPVSEWFAPGNTIIKEASIILTSGNIRRPDRVIIRNGKTTVIDFKFGEERPLYIEQIELYRSLLKDMGYENTEAFIWYVDRNKIVKV